MALDEGAMTDLLAALGAGGGLDVVGEALGLVLQALIDAEATVAIARRLLARSFHILSQLEEASASEKASTGRARVFA